MHCRRRPGLPPDCRPTPARLVESVESVVAFQSRSTERDVIIPVVTLQYDVTSSLHRYIIIAARVKFGLSLPASKCTSFATFTHCGFPHLVFAHHSIRDSVFSHLAFLHQTFCGNALSLFLFVCLFVCLLLSFFLSFFLSIFRSFCLSFILSFFSFLISLLTSFVLSFHCVWCRNTTRGIFQCGIEQCRIERCGNARCGKAAVRKHTVRKLGQTFRWSQAENTADFINPFGPANQIRRRSCISRPVWTFDCLLRDNGTSVVAHRTFLNVPMKCSRHQRQETILPTLHAVVGSRTSDDHASHSVHGAVHWLPVSTLSRHIFHLLLPVEAAERKTFSHETATSETS